MGAGVDLPQPFGVLTDRVVGPAVAAGLRKRDGGHGGRLVGRKGRLARETVYLFRRIPRHGARLPCLSCPLPGSVWRTRYCNAKRWFRASPRVDRPGTSPDSSSAATISNAS